MGSTVIPPFPPNLEWLEADGLGGFASGPVQGPRTRRYHALLLTATTPPTGRVVLVNGFDAWIETASGKCAISSQRYEGDVVAPDCRPRLEHFTNDPWPTWTYVLPDGTQIEQELFVPHEFPAVVVVWRLVDAGENVTLTVRPFLSVRDYHHLQHENSAFQMQPQMVDGAVIWKPYVDRPAICAVTNGEYTHAPQWYQRFLYTEERERGLDCLEDLATPGTFAWDLSAHEAVWILNAVTQRPEAFVPAIALLQQLRRRELNRRQRWVSPLDRAADTYVATRGRGKTIIAGFPWFTDWGRDTFISLRGLCLATGRLAEARDILSEWAGTVSEGMLPNRFPDQGQSPEFNAVDASLWYIIAVHEFLSEAAERRYSVAASVSEAMLEAVEAILGGYAAGTRYGIKLDGDGLLAAGVPGVQLTWMDAKCGDWVVTPRSGKPVEVQALWLNALALQQSRNPRWSEIFERGRAAFQAKFWDKLRGCLYDVVDVNHEPGTFDASFRPNQLFAVGGLPLNLLEHEQAQRLVSGVEARLWTPMGIRSLAPGEPGYCGRYDGDLLRRDGAYHQGTVWPWLLGPFVEAWVRVHGETEQSKHEARVRFLDPILQHLSEAGLGHIGEIADGDYPHTLRGCPFQAWSMGELLRLLHRVLPLKESRSSAVVAP